MRSQIKLVVGVALVTAAITTSATAGDAMQMKNRHLPYPEVKNISEGISWPAGQALPIFATPVESLDVIEVQALSADEQITFSALQGQQRAEKLASSGRLSV
jgi:hypothetical protein